MKTGLPTELQPPREETSRDEHCGSQKNDMNTQDNRNCDFDYTLYSPEKILLNPNLAFIFVYKLRGPSKNALKVAKSAVLAPFDSPSPSNGGEGFKTKY
jgi:hypothetical protein